MDKSLVQRAPSAGEPRYTMLETIRLFALDRLDAAGERDDARRRHAAYSVALAERDDRDQWTTFELAHPALPREEHENFRAALAWATAAAAQGDHTGTEYALRLGSALSWYWSLYDLGTDARAWYTPVLALAQQPATPIPAALRAKALWAAGTLARFQGDWPVARSLYEACAAVAREAGDAGRLADGVEGLAWLAQRAGHDLPAARAGFAQSLALRRGRADLRDLGHALRRQGSAATTRGDTREAVALGEEGLAIFRALGESSAVAYALMGLAHARREQGDLARSGALLEEALGIHRAVGDDASVAFVLHHLAESARAGGDDVHAGAHYRESLGVFLALTETTWIIARTHQGQGFIALRRETRPAPRRSSRRP